MTGPALVLNNRERELLQDATEWRLISMLFECPNPAWKENLETLAAASQDARLRQAAEAAMKEASGGLYYSAFGPGGPASPREVSYRPMVEFGGLLAELYNIYGAFGYAGSPAEPADHVSREADFVAYLRMKEAYARACGDTEHAEVTAEAARRFIEEHLSCIAEPLGRSLAASGIQYLALAGKALVERTGVRPPLNVLP